MKKMKPSASLLVSLVLPGLGLGALSGCDSDEPPDPDLPSWGVPISGGNLLVTADGSRAVVADPDRDRIVTVDLETDTTLATIPLTAGDEPGRLVEDGAGLVHVALRRGGAIVAIDPEAGTIVSRRTVCPEPRGLAWSDVGDVLYVACTDGDLVTFPAAGGAETRRLRLDGDLRDVVVSGNVLVVTRFRTSEILTLDTAGEIAWRAQPPVVQRDNFAPDTGELGLVDAVAGVAWRAVPLPDGRVVVSHQRRIDRELGTGEGPTDGYGGGGCRSGGPVEAAITLVTPGEPPVAVNPWFGTLPVDVAVSRDGTMISAAFAGEKSVRTFSVAMLSETDTSPCPIEMPALGVTFDQFNAPTSIAFGNADELVVFYPEVPALVVHRIGVPGLSRTIVLPGGVGYDAGRDMFHTAVGVGLACASCHPEGRDDGQVWAFHDMGPRRTQSIGGNVLARTPYHWSGDQVDLEALVTEVFEGRMGAGVATKGQRRALAKWLDRIPAPAGTPGDPVAIARGRDVFESPAVGCVACHNGPLYTNNQRVDVGTGGLFKVPSLLGVAARAPFIHDGCAPTLMDRLTSPCAGGDLHGTTSTLTAEQRADLVAFLSSL
jgi:hypothetical protein